MSSQPSSRIALADVDFLRNGRAILRKVSWRVGCGEHWAVIGANGSGKTTLLQIAVGYLWPNSGSVSALDASFGQVDLRQLRRHIGWVSASLQAMIRKEQPALQIVLSGLYASAGLFDRPAATQVRRARKLMTDLGCAAQADTPFGVLSLGEQQRVLIARALMPKPELLILDEACAGLDLPSREALLERVDSLARQNGQANLILVTHHIEEIPPAFTHVLVLRAGEVLAQGPKADVLTGPVLSAAFGLPVEVHESYGRFWPRIVRAEA